MRQGGYCVVVTLVIVLVGLALVVGKREWGKRLAVVAVGLVLVLSFLPMLLGQIDAAFGRSGSGVGGTVGDIGAMVVVLLLAGVGLALWRARSLLANRRTAEARRWGSPRDRAPIPAPRGAADDEEVRR